MWRQSTFPERRDSDQSISDDDEEFDRVMYDHDCLENLRSLYERGNKGQLQVASQLEILEEKLLHSTGGHELNFGGRTSTSLEKLESSLSEDEMHEFKNEDRSLNKYHPRNEFSTVSEDETISDEADEKETGVPSNSSCNPAVSKFRGSPLHNFESESQCGNCTWSEVLKEADELVNLHEYGSSSSHAVNSEASKFHKAAIGSKTKLKFSIRSRSCNEALSWPPAVNDETTKSSEVTRVPAVLEALENRVAEYSMDELLEDLQDENEKLSNSPRVPGESVALVHRGTEHSMSELLEGLQEKKGQPEGTSTMNTIKKERTFQLSRKRILFPFGDRVLDDEDPLEAMDCGMSSENEENCQNQLELATSKVKCQTMADRFQEAFREAALVDQGTLFPISGHTGIGYHGRLQQVVQNEKERNIEFLKHFQTGGDAEDESGSFDVQILSRYLDANLTVCHCSFGDKNKISPCMKSIEKLSNSGKKWKGKIIFTPRICGNIELEVGNLIRIYPPWREVQVMEDETIMLCTYFSHIST